MPKKKIKLGVLISGSGTNLQRIIDGCESGEIPAQVVLVISDKGDAYGLKRAQKHGVPNVFLNPKDFKSPKEYNREILLVLEDYDVDLVAMAGYMRLLGEEVIKAYPNWVMNIHPALLPSFPGEHGVRDALQYGVKVSGVTVQFANEVFDEGPIILQESVPVFDDDTEETLHQRLHEIEYRLYPEAIKLFAEGRLEVKGRKVIRKDESK